MKKLIFISLFVIPFCKAADNDNDENWNRTVQDPSLYSEELLGLNLSSQKIATIPNNPNHPEGRVLHLNLSNNLITTVPSNLGFDELQTLTLSNNWIDYLDPEKLQQFPRLIVLCLDKNPIHQKDVDELRKAYPKVFITAENLLEGLNIKGDY